MGQMFFVPMTRAELRAFEAVGAPATAVLVGHVATPALMHALEYAATMTEDADYAALVYAGVSWLISAANSDPLRLVVAAEVSAAQLTVVAEDSYGLSSASGVRWTDVSALFVDDAAARTAVAVARASATGLGLADALDQPAVESLLDEHELLWYAPQELDQLPEG